MTTRSFTRAAFLTAIVSAGALAAAPAAQAARSPEAEGYVQENAAEALRTLGDRNVPPSQRRQTFEALMARFADMPRIAVWVLGRYGAQLRADAALRSEWTRTFQEYAIAVYESKLGRYSGGQIRVTGSIENIPGRDIIVSSQLAPMGQTQWLPVQWRLLRSDGAWKVTDVSVVFEGGNQIWLAQQQRLEFLAALDRNNGDIRALMTLIRAQTTMLRNRVVARN